MFASLQLPPTLPIINQVRGLLLFNLSQTTGAPQAFSKWFSSNVGRPHFGGAVSQSSLRREVSKRRALVKSGQRLVAIKIWPVKFGRKWRWLHFPSFTDCAFADRCHLENPAKKVGPAEVLRWFSLGALGLVG